MKEIKVEFENFWNGFEPEPLVERLNRPLKNVQFVYDDIRSDLVISGCFPSNPTPMAYKPRLLLVTENLNLPQYDHLNANERCVKKIGYIEDGTDTCSALDWFFDYEELNNVNIHDNERVNGVCHVMRNHTPRRDQLIGQYQSSKLQSDMRFSEPHLRKKDKIEMIKQYVYNLCPENSIRSGYITEKIVESCLAGCVPIYDGGDLESYTPFNMDRVVYAGSDLPKDYEDIFNQPIFNENHKEMFEERRDKIESFLVSL